MDNYLSFISALMQQPTVLKQRKHLFLLSHMRANTSLIGHLLGEHPEISGYYEMHNGYYSWKSFLRQKLIYSCAHPGEKLGRIMFDKLLHNGHAISDEILLSPYSVFLISIRHPIQSVKSTVAQFQKKRPEHEFTQIENVAKYYVERIKQLETYALKLKGNYFYYDAESIIDNPSEILSSLSSYLSLQTPINETFSPKVLTGKGTSGDHSGNLLKGQIVKNSGKYNEIYLPDTISQNLLVEYSRVKQSIVENAANFLSINKT